MPDMDRLGERFRRWREKQGVSSTFIRKMTGIAESNLSNMEAGRRPFSDATLEKLAAIPELNISVETLIAWRLLDEYPGEALQIAYEEWRHEIQRRGLQ